MENNTENNGNSAMIPGEILSLVKTGDYYRLANEMNRAKNNKSIRKGVIRGCYKCGSTDVTLYKENGKYICKDCKLIGDIEEDEEEEV